MAKSKKKPAPKAKAKSAKKIIAKKPVKAAKKVAKPAKKATKPAKKPAAKAAAPKMAAKPATQKNIDLSKFVTPLDDRIIVQPAKVERMTAGGLYIPDTVSGVTGNVKGIVLAVGRGHRDPKGKVRPMDVQKGDNVVFAEFSGSKIKFQDHDLVIIRETDVLGIIS